MAFITAEMNADEMDEWFKIGNESSLEFQPKMVASSALKGQLFDPVTGGALEFDRQKVIDSKMPKYLRCIKNQDYLSYCFIAFCM